ncbi:MAG: DUF1707 domain-containing protein [Actinomycetota bacterium]|nr:DUF1707 domain-containing protein [Actinomycetota bacterium]
MRASDADRQEAIGRLRTALEEGRLKLDEYLDRMGQASEAVTYGDLTPLYSDLPETSPAVRPGPAAPVTRPVAQRPVSAPRAGCPAPLRILWTIWGAVVAVNLVIWVLVCASAGQLIYPWPIWVAGPWGAVLAVLTVSVSAGRRHPPGPHRLPRGNH